jgi:hypothetical protein
MPFGSSSVLVMKNESSDCTRRREWDRGRADAWGALTSQFRANPNCGRQKTSSASPKMTKTEEGRDELWCVTPDFLSVAPGQSAPDYFSPAAPHLPDRSSS